MLGRVLKTPLNPTAGRCVSVAYCLSRYLTVLVHGPQTYRHHVEENVLSGICWNDAVQHDRDGVYLP